jgi:hypothetical protein
MLSLVPLPEEDHVTMRSSRSPELLGVIAGEQVVCPVTVAPPPTCWARVIAMAYS